MKQFILSHDFYIFWYTLTKIKWLCGETTCKETLYKPGPHKAKMKNKLKHIKIYIYIYINIYIYIYI